MKKEDFIKKVSKITTISEDEFKAEFNSPELIWEVVSKIKPSNEGKFTFSGMTRDGVKVYGEFPAKYPITHKDGRECYSMTVFWAMVNSTHIDPDSVKLESNEK